MTQLNGFSPVWVLSCPIKALGSQKLLSHFAHWNGFSPVWVLSCVFKLLACEKLLSHFEHPNGFSPVWVLSCIFNFTDSKNLLSHFMQINGFSPVTWDMRGPKQEKNHSGAQSVTKASQNQVIWRHMRGPLMCLQVSCYCEALVTHLCMGNVMKITQLEVRTVRWVKFELSNPNSGLAEFELFVVRYLPSHLLYEIRL